LPEPKLKNEDLIKLVRQQVEQQREAEPDIKVDFKASGMKTYNFNCDGAQISQVLTNLLQNAIDSLHEYYIDKKDGKISIGFEENESNSFTLLIKDNGPGFPKEDRDSLTEPYITKKEKGTGLGLSVVHGIVKNYGGDIHVTSSLGQGSTFDVYFPAVKIEEKNQIHHDSKLPPTGNERILLVDDEIGVLRIEQLILERLGYTVDLQESSIDALEAVKVNPEIYDLVISDMTMPGMTGDQLTKKLLKLNPLLPIIICTGFSERISLEKIKFIGAKALLLKPIIRSKLAITIRNVLDDVKKTR
ncbi:MAG: ATP-binding protein, partial [Desulfobacula sp.]|nr:ATP-binding protein [Desulfobacula sp.]